MTVTRTETGAEVAAGAGRGDAGCRVMLVCGTNAVGKTTETRLLLALHGGEAPGSDRRVGLSADGLVAVVHTDPFSSMADVRDAVRSLAAAGRRVVVEGMHSATFGPANLEVAFAAGGRPTVLCLHAHGRALRDRLFARSGAKRRVMDSVFAKNRRVRSLAAEYASIGARALLVDTTHLLPGKVALIMDALIMERGLTA